MTEMRQRVPLAGVALMLALGLAACGQAKPQPISAGAGTAASDTTPTTAPSTTPTAAPVTTSTTSSTTSTVGGVTKDNPPPLEVVTVSEQLTPQARLDPVPVGVQPKRSALEAWQTNFAKAPSLDPTKQFKIKLGLFTDTVVHEDGKPLMWQNVLAYDIYSGNGTCRVPGGPLNGDKSHKGHTIIDADNLQPLMGYSAPVK
jgi:hypothetical protein